MEFAQTNLQLFRQAHNAGYSPDDILLLRRDYETSCLLHGAYMRPSGKPFLCHLVGAASVLIVENQALRLVRAAINHAAYDVGRFPTGARGMRPDHRRWLRLRVGDEVENLIWAYDQFEFSSEAANRFAAIPGADISDQMRDLLIMRMGNEVDDGLDYAAAIEGSQRWRMASYIADLITISRQFNLDHCAAVFGRIANETAHSDWLTPNEKMVFHTHRQSFPRYIKAMMTAWVKPFLRRE